MAPSCNSFSYEDPTPIFKSFFTKIKTKSQSFYSGLKEGQTGIDLSVPKTKYTPEVCYQLAEMTPTDLASVLIELRGGQPNAAKFLQESLAVVRSARGSSKDVMWQLDGGQQLMTEETGAASSSMASGSRTRKGTRSSASSSTTTAPKATKEKFVAPPMRY